MFSPQKGKHSAVIRIEKTSNLSNCTAFVINKTTAVTAAHCFTKVAAGVKDAAPIKDFFEVYSSTGEKTFIIAESSRVFEEDTDVALIKGNFTNFLTVPVDLSGFNIKTGETIYTCGFAGGFTPPVCNVGTFTGTRTFMGSTDAYVARGMSGGPVLNKDYKVIGVNASRTGDGLTRFGILFGLLRTEK